MLLSCLLFEIQLFSPVLCRFCYNRVFFPLCNVREKAESPSPCMLVKWQNAAGKLLFQQLNILFHIKCHLFESTIQTMDCMVWAAPMAGICFSYGGTKNIGYCTHIWNVSVKLWCFCSDSNWQPFENYLSFLQIHTIRSTIFTFRKWYHDVYVNNSLVCHWYELQSEEKSQILLVHLT